MLDCAIALSIRPCYVFIASLRLLPPMPHAVSPPNIAMYVCASSLSTLSHALRARHALRTDLLEDVRVCTLSHALRARHALRTDLLRGTCVYA